VVIDLMGFREGAYTLLKDIGGYPPLKCQPSSVTYLPLAVILLSDFNYSIQPKIPFTLPEMAERL